MCWTPLYVNIYKQLKNDMEVKTNQTSQQGITRTTQKVTEYTYKT